MRHQLVFYPRKFITMAVLVSAVACTAPGRAAENAVDSAGRRDSIAAVAAGSMNDANVIALLEMTNAADSAVGALGSERASTRELKDFGSMIYREHHALRRDAVTLAEQLGITPAQPVVPPDDVPAQQRSELQTFPAGPVWDSHYLDYAIAMHEAAKENTARALAAAQRPELKELIRKSVPILQKHLDKAVSLRKALGAVPAPKAPTKTATKAETKAAPK